MLVVNRLLAKRVESIGLIDTTAAGFTDPAIVLSI
jgi:hypothetical protein